MNHTLTPQQIGDRLLEIRTAIVDKIEAQPFLDASFRVDVSGGCAVSLYREYNDGDYLLETVRSDTFDGALDKAAKLIADMPAKNEIAKRDFLKSLGKVIDQGNEIGIETEFMNPLASTMKALSENILTDQRVAT